MGRQVGKCTRLVRTTLKKSVGETPFTPVHVSEMVSPIEIAVASHRVRYFSENTNDSEQRLELDLSSRWASEETHGKMHFATTRYYNRRVLSC